MQSRYFHALVVLLAGAGWVAAQPAATVPPPPVVVPAEPDPVAQGYDPGWNITDDAHPPYTFYAFGEALLWNLRDANFPILASSLPVGFVPVTSTTTVNGVATTTVTPLPVNVVSTPNIPGANEIDTSNHFGARIGAGFWFGDCNDWGMEFSAYWIEEKTYNFSFTNATNPQIFTIDSGLSNTVITTAGVLNPVTVTTVTPLLFPRQATVRAAGRFSSQMWGGEANVMHRWGYFGNVMFTGLTGLRYNELEEEGSLATSVVLSRPANVTDPAGAVFPDPLSYSTIDRFRATNSFYGAQIGAEMDVAWGAFFFNGRIKAALGAMRQELNVLGATTFTGAGTGFTVPGGLLSGPGMQGETSRNRVSWIPELNLKVGYRLGDWCRIHVGYDALYLQHVIRPSGQTEFASSNTTITVANSTQTFNLAQPVTRLRDLDVWVQGINAGIELRY